MVRDTEILKKEINSRSSHYNNSSLNIGQINQEVAIKQSHIMNYPSDISVWQQVVTSQI